MDVQRALLFIALGFVMLLIYQRWLEETKPPPSVATAPSSLQGAAPDANGSAAASGTVPSVSPSANKPEQSASTVPTAPAAPASTGSVPAVPGAQPKDPTLPSGDRVSVTTDLLKVEIDTHGGSMRRLHLLKYPIAVDKPNEPFTLLDEAPNNIFVTESGLTGQTGPYPNHETRYRAERTTYQLADGQQQLEVKLFWDAPNGVRYTKVFTFNRNSYDINVDFRVDNQSAQTWQGFMYV